MDKTDKVQTPDDKDDTSLHPEKNTMERKHSIFNHIKETKAKQKWHVNQMGEIIYKGHQSFSIMKQIQMGLKQSVLSSSLKDNMSLDDFKIRNKQFFPGAGDSKTPPHDFNDFVFYTYATPAFRNLRERFGISQDHFLMSLCQDKSLAIIGTPGKSGSLFFFSLDMQYILKTITKKESKAMREILPGYYNHVMSNPSTLITRFYGLYSIKSHRNKSNTVRFIVMNNVFDTPFKIDRRWDLKGSTVGREADEKELLRDTPIYKDLDILKQKKKISVGPEAKNRLLTQLKADCEWLAKIGIMDYSLLLGVHGCEKTDQMDILDDGDAAYLKMMNLNEQIHEESKMMEKERLSKESHLDLKTIEKKMSEKQIFEYSPRITTLDLQHPTFKKSSDEMVKHLSRGDMMDTGTRNAPLITIDTELDQLDTPRSGDTPVNMTPTLNIKRIDVKSDGLKDVHRVNSDRPTTATDDSSSSDSALTLSPRQSVEERNQHYNTPIGKIEPVKNPVRNSMLNILNPLSKRLSYMMGGKKHDKDEMIILKSIGPNRISDFQRIHGGMLSLPDSESGKREIYYLGIIDLLQKWNEKKKLESFFKGFQYDKKEISAVDPKTYAKRFYDFVEKLIE